LIYAYFFLAIDNKQIFLRIKTDR